MNVVPIKTRVVTPPKDDLYNLLDTALPKLKEESIVVISSKAVSICEGACIPKSSINKDDLIEREADQVITSHDHRGEHYLTLRKGLLIGSAGVDESNSGDYYIVLPRQPYASARKIWEHIRETQRIKRLGVIIADSTSVPLHRGAVGISLAGYGFCPVKSYVGRKDIFGRKLEVSATNLVDGIAASAVLAMGEGSEMTPIAVVTDLPDIMFYSRRIPLHRARRYGYVAPDLDIYRPLLHNRLWRKTK